MPPPPPLVGPHGRHIAMSALVGAALPAMLYTTYRLVTRRPRTHTTSDDATGAAAAAGVAATPQRHRDGSSRRRRHRHHRRHHHHHRSPSSSSNSDSSSDSSRDDSHKASDSDYSARHRHRHRRPQQSPHGERHRHSHRHRRGSSSVADDGTPDAAAAATTATSLRRARARDMRAWPPAMVQAWLNELGVDAQVCARLAQRHLDGAALLHLTRHRLARVGVDADSARCILTAQRRAFAHDDDDDSDDSDDDGSDSEQHHHHNHPRHHHHHHHGSSGATPSPAPPRGDGDNVVVLVPTPPATATTTTTAAAAATPTQAAVTTASDFLRDAQRVLLCIVAPDNNNDNNDNNNNNDEAAEARQRDAHAARVYALLHAFQQLSADEQQRAMRPLAQRLTEAMQARSRAAVTTTTAQQTTNDDDDDDDDDADDVPAVSADAEAVLAQRVLPLHRVLDGFLRVLEQPETAAQVRAGSAPVRAALRDIAQQIARMHDIAAQLPPSLRRGVDAKCTRVMTLLAQYSAAPPLRQHDDDDDGDEHDDGSRDAQAQTTTALTAAATRATTTTTTNNDNDDEAATTSVMSASATLMTRLRDLFARVRHPALLAAAPASRARVVAQMQRELQSLRALSTRCAEAATAAATSSSSSARGGDDGRAHAMLQAVRTVAEAIDGLDAMLTQIASLTSQELQLHDLEAAAAADEATATADEAAAATATTTVAADETSSSSNDNNARAQQHEQPQQQPQQQSQATPSTRALRMLREVQQMVQLVQSARFASAPRVVQHGLLREMRERVDAMQRDAAAFGDGDGDGDETAAAARAMLTTPLANVASVLQALQQDVQQAMQHEDNNEDNNDDNNDNNDNSNDNNDNDDEEARRQRRRGDAAAAADAAEATASLPPTIAAELRASRQLAEELFDVLASEAFVQSSAAEQRRTARALQRRLRAQQRQLCARTGATNDAVDGLFAPLHAILQRYTTSTGDGEEEHDEDDDEDDEDDEDEQDDENDDDDDDTSSSMTVQEIVAGVQDMMTRIREPAFVTCDAATRARLVRAWLHTLQRYEHACMQMVQQATAREARQQRSDDTTDRHGRRHRRHDTAEEGGVTRDGSRALLAVVQRLLAQLRQVDDSALVDDDDDNADNDADNDDANDDADDDANDDADDATQQAQAARDADAAMTADDVVVADDDDADVTIANDDDAAATPHTRATAETTTPTHDATTASSAAVAATSAAAAATVRPSPSPLSTHRRLRCGDDSFVTVPGAATNVWTRLLPRIEQRLQRPVEWQVAHNTLFDIQCMSKILVYLSSPAHVRAAVLGSSDNKNDNDNGNDAHDDNDDGRHGDADTQAALLTAARQRIDAAKRRMLVVLEARRSSSSSSTEEQQQNKDAAVAQTLRVRGCDRVDDAGHRERALLLYTTDEHDTVYLDDEEAQCGDHSGSGGQAEQHEDAKVADETAKQAGDGDSEDNENKTTRAAAATRSDQQHNSTHDTDSIGSGGSSPTDGDSVCRGWRAAADHVVTHAHDDTTSQWAGRSVAVIVCCNASLRSNNNINRNNNNNDAATTSDDSGDGGALLPAHAYSTTIASEVMLLHDVLTHRYRFDVFVLDAATSSAETLAQTLRDLVAAGGADANTTTTTTANEDNNDNNENKRRRDDKATTQPLTRLLVYYYDAPAQLAAVRVRVPHAVALHDDTVLSHRRVLCDVAAAVPRVVVVHCQPRQLEVLCRCDDDVSPALRVTLTRRAAAAVVARGRAWLFDSLLTPVLAELLFREERPVLCPEDLVNCAVTTLTRTRVPLGSFTRSAAASMAYLVSFE